MSMLVLKAAPQPAMPPTPRIIRRPEDLEEKRGWGDERWMQWKHKPGSVLTGNVLKPHEVPDMLHHVTSDMPGVQSSGMLQGKQDGGGFGGGQAEGVSFTHDRAMAEHLHREMLRMGRVSRGEVHPHHFDQFAREDEHIHGLPQGAMQPALEFSQRAHDANAQSPVYDSPAKLRSLAKDSYNSYLIARDSVMRNHGKPSNNPMFFTDAETASKWTPDKVGIVSVPKHAIPKEALTTTGSDDWLSEVRAYSDVPTHQGQFWPEAKPPVDPVKPPWKYKRDEYAPFPSQDAPGTVMDDYFQRDRDWRSHVKQALSEGTLHPEDARRQGFDDSRVLDKMQPMPDTLYHVTTNKTQALKQGLKSRAQLGTGAGAGLGGGDEDTISMTDNPETAKRIHDALHEHRSLLRGEIKPEELLHQAAMGQGAEKPWLHNLVQGGGNLDIQGAKEGTDTQRVEGADWKSKLPPGWQAFLQGRTIQRGSMQDEIKQRTGAMAVKDIQAKGYEPVGPTWRGGDGELYAMHYHRPMTEDERLRAHSGLYKLWSAHREAAGGPEDPLFFQSDPKKLATTPKEDIDILKVHPHPGTRGIKQNALGEYRTYSGKALRLADQARKSEMMAKSAMVLYHGSPREFSKWDARKTQRSTLYGGMSFTNDREEAQRYGPVRQVRVAIKNPMKLHAKAHPKLVKLLEQEGQRRGEAVTVPKTNSQAHLALQRVLGGHAPVNREIRKLGYDGLQHPGMAGGKGMTWVAFHGSQVEEVKSEGGTVRPTLVLKATRPVIVPQYVRLGHLVSGYTAQREEATTHLAEVVHPYDAHGVFSKLGIHVQQVRTARGNPAIAFTGNTYPHNRIFQALKTAGVVWGDSRTLGRFAWMTFEDRMPRVLTAFRGDEPEPAQPVPAPAAPRPMPSWTAPGPRAPVAAPLLAPAPVLVQAPPPRPQGPAPTGNWAKLSLEEALRVQPPTPTQLPAKAVADKLIGHQAEDVGLVMDAMHRGEEAFLLGNSTGTGKTYVAAATLASVKPERALVVVMNQGLIDQWQGDAGKFGVEVKKEFGPEPGIYATTYAGLDKLVKERGLNGIGRFNMVIYDEPHMQIMKPGSRGKLADDVSKLSPFSLYMTATPAEEPQQMPYLSRLNLWKRFTSGDQRRWMEEHGVQYVPQRTFRGDIVTVKVFRGNARQKTEHMARLRAEIVGPGKGVFRELQIDPSVAPLTSKFHTTSGASTFTDQVTRALGALQHLPNRSIFAAVKVNIAKRLLDYEKLDPAVDMAVESIRKGQRVAAFVSNVAPFKFEHPEEEDEPEAGMRQSQVRDAVVNAFRQAGLRGELPSPVEYMVSKLRERLGDDKAVYEYTGEVSDAKRRKIKKAFQAGELKAIVATIAAGGTGLSLHDTIGVAPRTQINVGLPWTGRDLSQLLGRTYRIGVRSAVHHTFLLTPDPREQKVATRVAGKLQSMGAFVHGIESDTNQETLAHFGLVGGLPEDDDAMEKSLQRFFLRGVLVLKARAPKGVLGLVRRGNYGLLTAENPGSKPAPAGMNRQRTQQLHADLRARGYKPIPATGHYAGSKERSFLVPNLQQPHGHELAKKYGQSAWISRWAGTHRMFFGPHTPEGQKHFPTGHFVEGRRVATSSPSKAAYSEIGKKRFSLQGWNWGAAKEASEGIPDLVVRRYVIHTDEGDIPVELTFDPMAHRHPLDEQPGIGLRVSPTVSA